MSIKDDKIHIDFILKCIHDVQGYVAEFLTVEEALADMKTYDAVLRKLQIMAETTQRLSDAYKSAHGSVDWGQIAGFRNALVHDYLANFDPSILPNVIDARLVELERLIKGETA
jgi:uncharacterized protein with HEPN domain